MITKEQASKFIGRHCNIEWEGGGMSGTVAVIDEEGYLVVDYGYGIHLNDITKLEAEDAKDSKGSSR